MKALLFLRCVASYNNCLFGVITAVAVMLLPPISAVAQDIPAEKERDRQVLVGFHLSGRSGFNLHSPWIVAGNIESPEDDVMPYPFLFISTIYNKYQATFGWAMDGDRRGQRHRHNESIRIFTARYNYYPFKKILYVFGGGRILYFDKKFSFPIYYPCDGECIITEIKTDRPDGRSTRFGMTTGVGVEYTIFGRIVLSHELEYYFFPSCSYTEFICSGIDPKFLGLHLEF